MKKRNGFTLIELIVGMAIMAIIFGGIVYIFGATTSSAQMGMSQQQAYEDARTTMELLKTSLRYASQNTEQLRSTKPTVNTTSYYYTTMQFDKHWNIKGGTNKVYIVTVALTDGTNPDGSKWTDKTKKQLVITIENVSTDSNDTKKIVKYPRYAENSAFKGNDFPITVADKVYGSDVDLYKITLPVQYKHNGAYKQDTLISNVTPTEYGNSNLGSDAARAQAEVLINAVTELYTKFPSDLKLKSDGNYTNNISSAAFNDSKVSGITKNLKSHISISNPEGIAILGETAWVIAALDDDGKVIPKTHPTSVAKWRVFIAKNCINDVDKIYKTSKAEETFKNEALKGNYIVRDGFGLQAYTYDSESANSNIIKSVNSGYMTAFRYVGSGSDFVMLNFFSWQSNYLDVKKYKSGTDTTNSPSYIEDYDSSGKKYTASPHTRIDYDGTGAEYIVSNHTGTDYEYPPNGATGKTGQNK